MDGVVQVVATCREVPGAWRESFLQHVRSPQQTLISTDEVHQVPALQNKVVEVFSCRLYQRRHTSLDLEILHYVYDNTGPGSQLRMLFVHISMWYGSQDVFAQMLKDMPPVFQADFAAQHTKRALKLVEEVSIDPWDLTEFLLVEVAVTCEKRATEVKLEKDDALVFESKHDGLKEELRNKRKRTAKNGE